MVEEQDVELYLNEQLDQRAAALAAMEGDFPEAPKKDSLLNMFRSILSLKKWEPSSKTGYLTKEELGKPSATVRGLLEAAHYAESEGMKTVAEYLRRESSIVNWTSLSRSGRFLTMPFTMKKISQTVSPSRETTKSNWYGGKETVREGGEEG